jgi:hypothetical protein
LLTDSIKKFVSFLIMQISSKFFCFFDGFELFVAVALFYGPFLALLSEMIASGFWADAETVDGV